VDQTSGSIAILADWGSEEWAMGDLWSQELEAEFARVVVAQLSPEELPLFGAKSRAFFADPKRARATRGGGDEVLGFGLSEAAGLLTPAVLAAACHLASYLTEEVGKAFAKAGVDFVVNEVKRLFRREPTAVRLDDAQIAQIREIAVNTARQFKLSNPRAALLADALVGHFVSTSSP
jgi:hypothetical protein